MLSSEYTLVWQRFLSNNQSRTGLHVSRQDVEGLTAFTSQIKTKESTHLFYLVKKPSLASRIWGLIFDCIKTTSGESVCELELAKWVTGKRNLR